MKNNGVFWCILIFLGSLAPTMLRAQPSNVTLTINGKQLDVPTSAAYEASGAGSNAVRHLVAGAIRRELLQRKIKEAGISVPDTVLSNVVDLYFSIGKITPEIATGLSQKSKALVAALKAVVLHHEDKAEVYARQLKDVISREEWQVWVANYGTPQKIQELERAIPESLEDMKAKSKAGLRQDVEAWLLFHRLTEAVGVSDGQLQAKYRQMYPTGVPPFDQVSSEVRRAALQEIRQEYLARWWKSELEKLAIRVPPDYESALEDAKVPPSARLPQQIIDLLEHFYK